MDYYTIDFETASSNPTSACSIGIVGVLNGKIVLEKHILINPMSEFTENTIAIHKITPDMVANEPTFDIIWPEIKQYFNNSIVFSHNSSFDFVVLKSLLEKYNIEKPFFKIGCTYRLAKQLWTSDEVGKYSLASIAAHMEHTFNHHNALSDAVVSALIINRGLRMQGVDDIITLHDVLGLRFGYFGPKKMYHPFKLKARTKKQKPKVENEFLFDKLIVLSGTPRKLKKSELIELLIGNGGYVDSLVSSRCDIFVKLANCKESKIRQVEELIKKGNDIQIMNETEILKLVKRWN